MEIVNMPISSSNTICETYNHARKFRAKHPLPHGKYKLDEADRACDRLLCDLRAVGEYIRNPDGVFEATGCRPNDYKQWLESIPAVLADLIGSTIEPAVYALQNDEADPHCVATTKDYIAQAIPKLLSDLERAHMTKAPCERLIVLTHRVQHLATEALTCTT